MIKRLRRRFIITAMISVLAVLTIIVGAINLINYRAVLQDADNLLQFLSENRGEFPSDMKADMWESDTGNPPELPSEDDSGALHGPQPGTEGEEPPEPPSEDDSTRRQNVSRRRMRRGITAETPYESRYFSVTLDAEGKIAGTDLSNIAAIGEEQAASYASSAASSGKASGFISYYRYLCTENDGETQYLFLDCNRSLRNFRSFLFTSLLVAAVGFAAVLLLIMLLSRRIMRPVEESYAKQKRFITDAGHELKTPLTVIDADISVLEMDVGENEWIDDVRMQTKRLAKLTNDLVYLSKMDEENRSIEKIDFPVSDVISEEAQSFRARAMVEEKKFSADIEPMLNYRGEEKAIRQLITILLDNALKYSPEGGSVSVRLSKQSKVLLLSVTNTTKEVMDPEALEHLFDRFYRTDQSRNSSTGGYGLGLSIARAVVSAHKGKISASAQDGGRQLTITAQLP